MSFFGRAKSILPYLIILFVWTINLGLYFAHKMTNLVFNDDALYLPALYKDLIINGGTYSSWSLTPAPYFFPDMLLYFFSNLVTQNFYYAIPLFFILESLLLLFAVYKIYTLFFDKSTSFSLASIVFALLYLFPTIASSFQYVSAFHYGEFVVGVLALYLVLAMIKAKHIKLLYLFFILLLSSLTVASDELYVLHFILPFSAALFILWSIREIDTPKLLTLTAALGISVWLGKVIHNLLVVNENAQNIELVAESFPVNLGSIEKILLGSYQHYTAGTLFAITALILAVISFVLKNRLSFFYREYKNSDIFLFISLFLIFLELGSFAVLSLSSVPLVANRYMIPLFFIPIILLPLYFDFFKFFKYKNLSNMIINSVLVILLIALLLDGRKKLMHTTLHSEYYPPLQQCIDNFIEETGAKHGISEYWRSKSTYVLSKYDITVAEVYDNLSPRTWITTSDWYRDIYDFALILYYSPEKDRYSPNKDTIIAINGNPDKVYHCDDTDILYYKNGMYTKPFAYRGASQAWKGSDLPSVIGEKSDSVIAAKHGNKWDVVSFGPYAVLPAGKYSFDIVYKSSEAISGTAGNWDVAVATEDGSKRLMTGILQGSDNQDKHLIREFQITKEFAYSSVEIRTFYGGKGTLIIKSLTITKLK